MTRNLAVACSAMAAAAMIAADGPIRVPAAATARDGFTTWIERRAPGAFDPAPRAALRGLRVAYRMDAEILVPLVVTSIQLLSRAGVGAATASYRDFRSASGETIRAYEFFTTSLPERARGIDRMGFFREALGVTAQAVDWTAYFGTMTASPERTLAQAERATGGQRVIAYEVTDGYSCPTELKAGVFDIEVDRRGTNAEELYETVRPKLGGQTPRYTRSLEGGIGRTLPPVAFLGALQVSLRGAAVSRETPQAARAPRVAFVHNGTVRYLVVDSLAPDLSRGRAAAAQGFAANAALVYRLDFRIVNPGDADGVFRLWAELPARADRAADALPIAPIAFELTPRSFLRLHFDRSK
jgi:hypothetical protein